MLLYDEECLRRVVPMQEVQQIAHYKAQDDINKLLNGTDTEFRAMQRTVGFSRKDMEKRKEQKKNQIYSSYKEAQSYMKIAEVRSTRCARSCKRKGSKNAKQPHVHYKECRC